MEEKTKLIKPQNTLKKKVGHGGFRSSDLIKAQAAIENNKIDFKPIARDLLKELSEILSSIDSGQVKPSDSLGVIMYPLMQLRAQGSLFHYPSITHISDIVVDFLDSVAVIDSDILEILTAYQKAANAVLSFEIKDASSKVGQDLCDELKAVCQRYKEAKIKK